MARKLRYTPPGCVVEATCRALHGRFLTMPTPLAVEIILGVIGRAQARTGMRIHAFVFLSNHYHMLLSPESPEQLAAFMCFVNSNIARELGRIYGWPERFWSRRFQSIVVSGEEAAQLARLKYIASHGCKEGFVATPADWPGAHCIRALLTGEPLNGTWFDRTAENKDRRQGVLFGARDHADPETIALSPLPCWEHLSEAERRARFASLVQEIEEETRALGLQTGRTPLGPGFVRRQNPHDRPQRSKRSPAPSFHAATKAVRLALVEAYRIFLAAYRRAAEKLRAGDRFAEFPEGSFPPRLPFVRGPSYLAST